jgi:hypothetical protein
MSAGDAAAITRLWRYVMENVIVSNPVSPRSMIWTDGGIEPGRSPLSPMRHAPKEPGRPGAGKTERRRLARQPVREGAFALLRSRGNGLCDIRRMTMGDIACAVFRANPSKMGRIIDVSMGGLAFSYIDGDACRRTPCRLDILVADSAFYIKNLLFRAVTDMDAPGDPDLQVMKMKLAGLQFMDLSPYQKSLLDHFIRRHAKQI